jgi:hypothetical protein
MTESKRKSDKIACPETHHLSPDDIVKDHTLSHEEKRGALSTSEQDARQLLTASNEGMPGSEEGIDKDDSHRLGEIVRAKTTIGERLKHKSSHTRAPAENAMRSFHVHSPQYSAMSWRAADARTWAGFGVRKASNRRGFAERAALARNSGLRVAFVHVVINRSSVSNFIQTLESGWLRLPIPGASHLPPHCGRPRSPADR